MDRVLEVHALPNPVGTLGVSEEYRDALMEVARRVAASPADYRRPWVGLPFPTACIDGRPGIPDMSADEAPRPMSAPALRLAGGSVSVWVGLLLSGGLPLPGSTDEALESLSALCSRMNQQGFALSTHQDDHAVQPNCGCGAADHCGTVLGIIAQDSEALSSMLTQWGVEADVAAFAEVARALSPTLSGVGKRIHDTICAVHPSAGDHMHGPHLESMVWVNTQPGAIIDRGAVGAALHEGGVNGACALDYAELDPTSAAQVFVIDAWALPQIGHLLDAPRGFVAAAAAYNAAALLALCGPRVPVLSAPLQPADS